MATLGGNPGSFAGWIEHGAGWQFACRYQVPSGNDILITRIHCYFDTYQGNGAVGHLVIWSNGGDYHVLADITQGIIANGSLSAGGQQWWSQPVSPALKVAKSSSIWIGMWCDQNIVVSTFDTSPQTYAMNSGSTSHPTGFLGASNSGQGPLGAYVEYSPLVYGGMSAGSNPSGLSVMGRSALSSGVIDAGSSPSGLLLPSTLILSPSTVQLGSNGGGLSVTTTVKRSHIYVWR